MSDINSIILEDISSLTPYKDINKHIRAATTSYRNAIKAHNSGDSATFANQMLQHRNHEIALHSLLSRPNYLSSGKHNLSRQQNSNLYLQHISARPLG